MKDYGFDCGNLHVIDRALHLARTDLILYGTCITIVTPDYIRRIPPQDWRYLDGEEEREGIYR